MSSSFQDLFDYCTDKRMETLPTSAQVATLFHWRHGADRARAPRLKEMPSCRPSRPLPREGQLQPIGVATDILIPISLLNSSGLGALRTPQNSRGSR